MTHTATLLANPVVCSFTSYACHDAPVHHWLIQTNSRAQAPRNMYPYFTCQYHTETMWLIVGEHPENYRIVNDHPIRGNHSCLLKTSQWDLTTNTCVLHVDYRPVMLKQLGWMLREEVLLEDRRSYAGY